MLVEDDNNLREIYEARLLAEGYEIVSAKDGEEALALAVKEKPDLIISDVMMPKISGFDMLDILRSTAETKNTKVIMMTALSQAEDKARADKLGADRYLVKSQVTLEDVAKVAHDVLSGEDPAPKPTAAAEPTPAASAPQAVPVAEPPAAPTASEPPAAPSYTPPPEEPVAATTPPPATEPVAEAPMTTPTPIQVTDSDAPEEDESLPEAPAQQAPEALVAEQPAPVQSVPEPMAEPASQAPEPTPAPVAAIDEDLGQTTAAEEAAIESQINEIFAEPVPAEEEAAPEAPEPPASNPTPEDSSVETIEVAAAPGDTSPTQVTEQPSPAPSAPEPAAEPTPEPAPATPLDSNLPPSKRVIQPISDVTKAPNLDDLLKQEESLSPVTPPAARTILNPVPPPLQDVTPPQTPPAPGTNVISPGDIAL